MRFALDVTNLWYSPDPFQHQNAGHINSHLEPTSHFESYPANIVDWSIEPTPSNNESRSISPKPGRPNSTVAVDCIPCQVTKNEKTQRTRCMYKPGEGINKTVPGSTYIYIIYNHMYIFLDRWMIYKYSLRICQVSLQYIWLVYIYIYMFLKETWSTVMNHEQTATIGSDFTSHDDVFPFPLTWNECREQTRLHTMFFASSNVEKEDWLKWILFSQTTYVEDFPKKRICFL